MSKSLIFVTNHPYLLLQCFIIHDCSIISEGFDQYTILNLFKRFQAVQNHPYYAISSSALMPQNFTLSSFFYNFLKVDKFLTNLVCGLIGRPHFSGVLRYIVPRLNGQNAISAGYFEKIRTSFSYLILGGPQIDLILPISILT